MAQDTSRIDEQGLNNYLVGKLFTIIRHWNVDLLVPQIDINSRVQEDIPLLDST